MIMIHNLKSEKERIGTLSSWLDKPMVHPSADCNLPELRLIAQFKEWVFSKANSKIILHPATSTEDLLGLCNDGWMELQTINAFMPIINVFSHKRKVFSLNSMLEMVETALEITVKNIFHDLEQIAFLANVGKHRGRTFSSNQHISGSHWALLMLDLRKGTFQYCDSFCWEAPQNMAIQLNRIVAAINRVCIKEIAVPSMITCARPAQGQGGVHCCREECLVNYPIQQCSDICGVISVIMAAVFVNAPMYWDDVITSTSSAPTSLLKNPTQHSSYLRKVLIPWLIKQCTDMANLGTVVDKEPGMNSNIEAEFTKERQELEMQKCKQHTQDRRTTQRSYCVADSSLV